MDIITVTKPAIYWSGLLNIHFYAHVCSNNLWLQTSCKYDVPMNTSFMQNLEKVGNSYS